MAWFDQNILPSLRKGLVSFYKGKGDVQRCSNYRGSKLLHQTMNIWEKIIDARLRKVTGVASN